MGIDAWLKQLPPPVLEAIDDWKTTKKWQPFRVGTFSGGRAVECPASGRLGFAKPTQVWNEWLAWKLASVIGACVPEVRFGTIDGGSHLYAVSHVFGRAPMDLRRTREILGAEEFESDQQITAALKKASGLLPLYAWIGLQDVKDEHLLFDEDVGQVAGIDHGFSFRWATPEEPVSESNFAPPLLVRSPDPSVVRGALERIEALDPESIGKITLLVPDGVWNIDTRCRVRDGLIWRRSRIRPVMMYRGWI